MWAAPPRAVCVLCGAPGGARHPWLLAVDVTLRTCEFALHGTHAVLHLLHTAGWVAVHGVAGLGAARAADSYAASAASPSTGSHPTAPPYASASVPLLSEPGPTAGAHSVPGWRRHEAPAGAGCRNQLRPQVARLQEELGTMHAANAPSHTGAHHCGSSTLLGCRERGLPVGTVAAQVPPRTAQHTGPACLPRAPLVLNRCLHIPLRSQRPSGWCTGAGNRMRHEHTHSQELLRQLPSMQNALGSPISIRFPSPVCIHCLVCAVGRQFCTGQQPLDAMGCLPWVLFAIMAQLAAGQGSPKHDGYALQLIKDYNLVRAAGSTYPSVTTQNRACARCQPTASGRSSSKMQ